MAREKLDLFAKSVVRDIEGLGYEADCSQKNEGYGVNNLVKAVGYACVATAGVIGLMYCLSNPDYVDIVKERGSVALERILTVFD